MYVYLIVGADCFKVGISKDPDRRLPAVAGRVGAGAHVETSVRVRDRARALEVERSLHVLLKPHARGGECFNMAALDTARGFFATLADAGDVRSAARRGLRSRPRRRHPVVRRRKAHAEDGDEGAPTIFLRELYDHFGRRPFTARDLLGAIERGHTGVMESHAALDSTDPTARVTTRSLGIQLRGMLGARHDGRRIVRAGLNRNKVNLWQVASDRPAHHPWEDEIDELLVGKTFVSTRELLEALAGPPSARKPHHAHDLARMMASRAGWVPDQKMRAGVRARGYSQAS